MPKILTAAWAALLRLVNPDVDAIIASFLKAQSKLGKYIERELQQTEAETQAIEDAYAAAARLLTSRDARNEAINRAYRVIHRLDQLTV